MARGGWAAAGGERVAFTALVLGTAAAVGLWLESPLAEGDFGWHLANGRRILAQGHIVFRQTLAGAAHGAPWADPAWLWDVAVAWAYPRLGVHGLMLAAALLLVVAGALLGRMLARARPAAAVAGALIAGYGLVPLMPLRPEIASYAFFALALAAVEELRQGRFRLFALSAAALPLWAQVHGSWPLGALVPLWECLFLPRRVATLVVGALIPALVAVALLPTGHGDLGFFAAVGSGGNLGAIQEWQSPDFHMPELRPLLGLVAVGGPLLGWGLVRRRDWAGLGWLVGGVAATLVAVRFLPYLTFAWALLLARVTPARFADGSMRFVFTLAALVFAGLFLRLAWLRPPPADPLRPAVAYVAHLRPSGAVFNAYELGGPLELAGVEPYIDGRDDIWVREPFWPAYLALTRGELPVDRYLARWDPTARVAVWPLRSPVAWQLDRLPGWHRTFVRNGIGVWRRTDGAPGHHRSSARVSKAERLKTSGRPSGGGGLPEAAHHARSRMVVLYRGESFHYTSRQ